MQESQIDIFIVTTIALLALAASLVFIAIFQSRPRAMLAAWALVAFGVPYWVGLPIGVFVPIIVVISVIGAISQVGRLSTRWTVFDISIGVLTTFVSLAIVLVPASSYDASVVLAQWIGPFILGRFMFLRIDPHWGWQFFGIAAILLAIIAVIEYGLDWHPWVNLTNDSNASRQWAPIQYRYGAPRSEWVFGHSISLGNILAMTIPFIVFTRWSSAWKILALLLVTFGVTTTGSRNALIAAMIAFALSVYAKSSQNRWGLRPAMASIAALIMIAASPLLLDSLIFGTDAETSESTSARLMQWTLFSSVRPLGDSGTLVTLFDGQPGYLSENFDGGAARSVDNTLILLGLNLGWLPTASLIAILGLFIWNMPRFGDNPAGLAIVSQIPTLLTVAMITQYASFFWLVAGMAAASYASLATADIGTRRLRKKVPRAKRMLSTPPSET